MYFIELAVLRLEEHCLKGKQIRSGFAGKSIRVHTRLRAATDLQVRADSFIGNMVGAQQSDEDGHVSLSLALQGQGQRQ